MVSFFGRAPWPSSSLHIASSRLVSDTRSGRGDRHVPSGGTRGIASPVLNGPRMSRLSAHPLNGLTHLTEKTHRRLMVAWRPMPMPRASNEKFSDLEIREI